MPIFSVTVYERRSYVVSVEADDESEAAIQAIWQIENDAPIEPDNISIDAEDCHVEDANPLAVLEERLDALQNAEPAQTDSPDETPRQI